MSNSGRRASRPLAVIAPRWRWQKPINTAHQERWLALLAERGITSWALLERPGYVRLSLQAFFPNRRPADALVKLWGGRVTPLTVTNFHPGPTPPLRISSKFYIIHEEGQTAPGTVHLHLPFGVAFGSGEHATTLMLLRALVARGDCSGIPILDLGTGTGVLALAARRLGATRIVGTDFDPAAIRTAQQNERLNFEHSHIDWRCADVLRLRQKGRYGLVLANLFSGILIQASPRIAASLTQNGELWLSGVLRTQAAEVEKAYRSEKLKLIRTIHRGKWVMQQWKAGTQDVGTGVMKTT